MSTSNRDSFYDTFASFTRIVKLFDYLLGGKFWRGAFYGEIGAGTGKKGMWDVFS